MRRNRHGGNRLGRAAENAENQRRNLERLRAWRAIDPEVSAFDAAVNRLTNWQRNQWARKGYPGSGNHKLEALNPFFTLKKGTHHEIHHD